MAVLPVLRGGHLAPLRNLVAGRPAGSWLRCLSETKPSSNTKRGKGKDAYTHFLNYWHTVEPDQRSQNLC